MMLPVQLLRILVMIISVGTYIVLSLLLSLLIRNRWKRIHWTAPMMSICAKILLKSTGGKITVKGSFPDRKDGPFLLVSNHLSYIDVFLLSSFFPTCFVTSVEMKETPFLGHCAMAANSLFVERRSRSNLRGEIRELQEALENGINVAIYPEATSTNGDELLRFRRPLYAAAVQGKRPVLPLCLNYRKANGQPLTRKNRDLVYWYGDMSFALHFLNMCSLWTPYEVEMTVMSPVESEGSSSAELARITHEMISAEYTPCRES